jgi:hypothetical protein
MHTPWGTKRPLAVTYLVAVEVDINIELLEVAPSTSTAVAPGGWLGCVIYMASVVDTHSRRLISISRVSFSGGGGDGGAGGGGGVGVRALTTPVRLSVLDVDAFSQTTHHGQCVCDV